jgi:ribose 5-phosphate isomerase B
VQALRIAVGADHAGYELKERLKALLAELGHEVVDLGTHGRESCDYPDFARAVGERVARGEVERGILVCGTGIGMAIAANKIPGVRAAVCQDPVAARLARQHNDSNVLALGARLIGPAMAEEVVRVWLETAFAGGRHRRRVDKIRQLERAIDANPPLA